MPIRAYVFRLRHLDPLAENMGPEEAPDTLALAYTCKKTPDDTPDIATPTFTHIFAYTCNPHKDHNTTKTTNP